MQLYICVNRNGCFDHGIILVNGILNIEQEYNRAYMWIKKQVLPCLIRMLYMEQFIKYCTLLRKELIIFGSKIYN